MLWNRPSSKCDLFTLRTKELCIPTQMKNLWFFYWNIAWTLTCNNKDSPGSTVQISCTSSPQYLVVLWAHILTPVAPKVSTSIHVIAEHHLAEVPMCPMSLLSLSISQSKPQGCDCEISPLGKERLNIERLKGWTEKRPKPHIHAITILGICG